MLLNLLIPLTPFKWFLVAVNQLRNTRTFVDVCVFMKSQDVDGSIYMLSAFLGNREKARTLWETH